MKAIDLIQELAALIEEHGANITVQVAAAVESGDHAPVFYVLWDRRNNTVQLHQDDDNEGYGGD